MPVKAPAVLVVKYELRVKVPPVTFTVPWLMSKRVKVLAGPERVSVPVPVVVIELPALLMVSAIVVLLLTVRFTLLMVVWVAVVKPAGLKLRLPPPAKVMLPVIFKALASVIAVPLSLKVPPLIFNVPVPTGPLVIVVPDVVLSPAIKVPALSVVPPV